MTRSNLILLIEDNSDDVALTLNAFKRVQVESDVTVVSDGPAALDLLLGEDNRATRPAVTPTLILLDVNLPQLRGTEVLRRLRDDPRTALIPVVMLTTSGEERDIRESYELGANSYLRKPVDYEEFVALLQDLADYWLRRNVVAAPGLGACADR